MLSNHNDIMWQQWHEIKMMGDFLIGKESVAMKDAWDDFFKRYDLATTRTYTMEVVRVNRPKPKNLFKRILAKLWK